MGTNGSKGANATTLGMVVARRVEVANVSDRRVGARLLAGLQSGFQSIRTVMADAGYESRKLARELKRRHGWRLHITKRRQRAFKVCSVARYSRKFSHVNCDGSFGTESGISTVLSIC